VNKNPCLVLKGFIGEGLTSASHPLYTSKVGCVPLAADALTRTLRLGVTWPSGKAEDCKSSIPSSSLGVA
jgi:hypothetical protein